MIEERQGGGAPHGILLAIVVAIVVVVPFLLGDQGQAVTDAISELLSPVGLLLLPIILLLTIQFLSSERGSFITSIFSTGEPDTIHRVSGSPVGVAFVLILILFLLYNRVSIFGGDDDSGDWKWWLDLLAPMLYITFIRYNICEGRFILFIFIWLLLWGWLHFVMMLTSMTWCAKGSLVTRLL